MGASSYIPAVVLRDLALLQPAHERLQNLIGIVSEVQVSHLRQGHGDDGECLLVFLDRTCADLQRQNICFLINFAELRSINHQIEESETDNSTK